MKKIFFLSLSLVVATAFLSAQGSGGTNPALIMYRYNSSSTLSPLPVLNGDLLGTLKWNGLVNYGNIGTGASIHSVVTGPVGPGLQASMIFSTSGSSGLTNRMIITAEGRIGMGTNTPSINVLNIPNADFKLHIVGNTYTSGNFYGRIHFDDNQSSNYLPNEYTDEAYFELKQRTTLTGANNLPGSANSRGGVLSLAPGQGSLDHQLFFGDDGVWNRIQSGANAWGNWYRFLTSENIHGRPNLVSKFMPPDNPSSKLGESQLFDNGTNVVIGGIPAGTNPTPTFNSTDLLTVKGNSLLGGFTNVTGELNVKMDATLNGGLQVDNNGRIDGRLIIGNPPTTPGTHKLYVNGSIIATEVRVALQASWSDYVFEKDYDLKPLAEVEKYVQENKHLPGVASAKEVTENGLNLGEMQKMQMEKIEELYLHVIEMNKQMNALQAENQALKAKIEKLEQR